MKADDDLISRKLVDCKSCRKRPSTVYLEIETLAFYSVFPSIQTKS